MRVISSHLGLKCGPGQGGLSLGNNLNYVHSNKQYGVRSNKYQNTLRSLGVCVCVCNMTL